MKKLDIFQNFHTPQTPHLGYFQANGPPKSDSTRHSGSNEVGTVKIEEISVKNQNFIEHDSTMTI